MVALSKSARVVLDGADCFHAREPEKLFKQTWPRLGAIATRRHRDGASKHHSLRKTKNRERQCGVVRPIYEVLEKLSHVTSELRPPLTEHGRINATSKYAETQRQSDTMSNRAASYVLCRVLTIVGIVRFFVDVGIIFVSE